MEPKSPGPPPHTPRSRPLTAGASWRRNSAASSSQQRKVIPAAACSSKLARGLVLRVPYGNIRSGHPPSMVLLRPIAQPGTAPRTFTALSVAKLAQLVAEAPSGEVNGPLQQALAATLSSPSVLNASFCYPGLVTARLDAAGLCKNLAELWEMSTDLQSILLDAASEGLRQLADGPVEDLTDRDQLRALAVYLALPAHRRPRTRRAWPVLCGVARIVARLPAAGRAALRDLLADECGDAAVLRDFFVPHVRAFADDAVRLAGRQPWLDGPLWEVVAQLQLQRPLWEAVLL